MERHALEPLSGRRHARQRVLRPVGPALELDRVDGELLGRDVSQQLGGDASKRHADAAIHADQVLVDVDRPRARLVVLEAIRCPGQEDRHHSFGDIEAQWHAIGADRGKIVHLHREDIAGLAQSDAALDSMVACLRVRDERLETVHAELDRPAEQDAGHDSCDFVRVDVDLQPEPAADVWRGHSDLMGRDAKMPTEYLLHLKRRLMGVDDGQRVVARVEVRDQAAGFERHRHLALETKLLFNHEIRRRERFVWLASLHRKVERDVVAELWVDDGRSRRGRLDLIRHRGQRTPGDVDELAGVFGLCPALRNHDRDRLSLPKRALRRQQSLWR